MLLEKAMVEPEEMSKFGCKVTVNVLVAEGHVVL